MLGIDKPWYKARWFYAGVVGGALYGVALRLIADDRVHFYSRKSIWVMSIAFIGVVPAVIGAITIREAESVRRTSVVEWIFLPWLPTLMACLLAVLFRLEGIICLVFAIPITLLGASMGGVMTGVDARIRKRPVQRSTMACLALLPLMIAPIESHRNAPVETRTVASQIVIHAPANVVWQNIERVRAIAPSELRASWAQRIGFPRPLEATLSHEGVGGVRHASFERGLMFIETVTAWEPQHRLAFGIKADTEHIPTTTLDEHVSIGGKYFDVLDGEYRLEPLPNSDILLHLTSHQRLSTDFNGYAGFWSDAVMQNLQTSILEVIQHRCEHVNS